MILSAAKIFVNILPSRNLYVYVYSRHIIFQ